MEDAMQTAIHHLPLGMRLHRAISAGGKIPHGDCKEGFLSKMYLTSFVGTDMVFKDDRIMSYKVNGTEVFIWH
eukprot:CAMPEP_0173098822 /NCGR_PEP_ID=MMETSP1102-20130122/35039_1 /TAXON_ID=49646 /ORGANISM="Geminigera sp., Strain Caron Lab Isolate" /LENGTH=72 /DNA_ID=CAMNT_0013991551 /DNA_START=392 /DNA_END=610 /DNA_ORIENTATION=-